jgi:hypothetical protein
MKYAGIKLHLIWIFSTENLLKEALSAILSMFLWRQMSSALKEVSHDTSNKFVTDILCFGLKKRNLDLLQLSDLILYGSSNKSKTFFVEISSRNTAFWENINDQLFKEDVNDEFIQPNRHVPRTIVYKTCKNLNNSSFTITRRSLLRICDQVTATMKK